MVAITTWILVAATVSSHPPTVIASFWSEQACEAALVDMERKSKGKSVFPTLYGICVKAEHGK